MQEYDSKLHIADGGAIEIIGGEPMDVGEEDMEDEQEDMEDEIMSDDGAS